MRMYPREFPQNRRGKPKRRAEVRVYEALAGSDRRGFCYYEWRRDYGRPELDFAVWTEGLGRFGLQVKGGSYLLIEGEWHLMTREGVRPVETSLLDEVWLEALDLHDDIKECAGTSYNPHVIPVLSFPDMTEPDAAIANLARRKGVYIVWGVESLLAALEGIARSRGVSGRLTMERIAREVEAVTDGQIRMDASAEREPDSKPARPAALSLAVSGRSLLQVRADEMRLRVETCAGAGAFRKGRRKC